MVLQYSHIFFTDERTFIIAEQVKSTINYTNTIYMLINHTTSQITFHVNHMNRKELNWMKMRILKKGKPVDAVSVGVRSYDDEIRRRFPGSGGVVSANSAGLWWYNGKKGKMGFFKKWTGLGLLGLESHLFVFFIVSFSTLHTNSD